MEKLRSGQPVSIPSYDFKTHQSIESASPVNPADVIILEGILVLNDPQVRDLMNMKIFVDTGLFVYPLSLTWSFHFNQVVVV